MDSADPERPAATETRADPNRSPTDAGPQRAATPDRPRRDRVGGERSKVLSVRLTGDEFDRLSAQAEVLGVGPSTLVRTYIRQGLSAQPSPNAGPATAPMSTLERQLLAELTARIEALERRMAER